MTTKELCFVLTAKSLGNVQEFFKAKGSAIKCGSETICVSKDLSILISMAMYRCFQSSDNTYQIDVSQISDKAEVSVVKCLNQIISLAESDQTIEVDKSETPILTCISKALQNAELNKQIDAFSSANDSTRLQWNSGFLSEFGFLPNFNEFCFKICGVEFNCPKILALLLSNEVFKQNIADSSISSFTLGPVDSYDSKEFTKAFEDAFELLSGHPLIVSYERKEIMGAVAAAIGCVELLSALESFDWQFPPIDVSNVYDRLRRLRTVSASKEFSEVIEFAAKHFFELNFDSLLSIPIAVIEKVLCSPQLRIENESQLFGFEKAFLHQNGKGALSILSKMRFEFLDPKEISDFVGFYDVNFTSADIWRAICNRLKCDVDIEERTENNQRYLHPRRSKISEIREKNGVLQQTNNKLLNDNQVLQQQNVDLQREIKNLHQNVQLVFDGNSVVGLRNLNSTGDVDIPEGITKIMKDAFKDSKIISVSFPNSLTEIDEGAFIHCTSLSSIVIPPSVTQIGDRAFCECTSLILITLSPNVTIIGDDIFGGCTNLKSITIPMGVTQIGRGAFDDCTSLSSVSVPKSVKYICESAFQRCSHLQMIAIPQDCRINDGRLWHSFERYTKVVRFESKLDG